MSVYPTREADITRNYHRGDRNSIEAHDSIKTVKQILRAKVVAHIAAQGAYGAISDEVEVALELAHQTCSARFTEAKAAGEIVDSGRRRPTRSGRNATVYVVPVRP